MIRDRFTRSANQTRLAMLARRALLRPTSSKHARAVGPWLGETRRRPVGRGAGRDVLSALLVAARSAFPASLRVGVFDLNRPLQAQGDIPPKSWSSKAT